MRRLFVVTAAALALAGAVAHAPTAWACTCVVGSTPQTLFRNADVVFVGTVSAVSTPDTDSVVRLAVSGVYKGTVPIRTEVRTARSVGDCGIAFVPGARYAVFASAKGGTYRVDLCGGTTIDVGMLARAGFHPGSPSSALAVQSDPAAHHADRAGPLAGAALLIVVIAGGIVFMRRARAGDPAPPAG
jgi:hypothetical protein